MQCCVLLPLARLPITGRKWQRIKKITMFIAYLTLPLYLRLYLMSVQMLWTRAANLDTQERPRPCETRVL